MWLSGNSGPGQWWTWAQSWGWSGLDDHQVSAIFSVPEISFVVGAPARMASDVNEQKSRRLLELKPAEEAFGLSKFRRSPRRRAKWLSIAARGPEDWRDQTRAGRGLICRAARALAVESDSQEPCSGATVSARAMSLSTRNLRSRSAGSSGDSTDLERLPARLVGTETQPRKTSLERVGATWRFCKTVRTRRWLSGSRIARNW